jgi:hypothetical protein
MKEQICIFQILPALKFDLRNCFFGLLAAGCTSNAIKTVDLTVNWKK